MVQLLKQKCLPILLHALDVCNLNKRTMQSLDFTLNTFFMKLFKTSNIEVVNYCQTLLDVSCQVPCWNGDFRNLLLRCNVAFNVFLCLMF